MRKVIGVIKTLKGEEYKSRLIKFQLCDRYGNPKNRLDYKHFGEVAGDCPRGENFEVQIATSGEVTTTIAGAFEVWLGVTECDELGDYYEMSFDAESGLHPIKLYVREGELVEFEKLTVPYVGDRALSDLMCDGKVDINLKNLFDRYFSGEPLHNANEQRMMKNYINYADGYNDKLKEVDEGVMDEL
jgi:hypothetical protein